MSQVCLFGLIYCYQFPTLPTTIMLPSNGAVSFRGYIMLGNRMMDACWHLEATKAIVNDLAN